ncbi:Serine/threonine-protein kinase Nek2 [Hondaea fermentalgiana]|uniref:Serine/threonine-protein kinase Nek2 n=1 Tax=Hondaea fermentalgiana TaxID=2315210 RepID=A0A2R5GGH4_9STRA|nr:Serine/threonine-protein kinase Nek2 [Hondaea fermentalgiana]|eukprot:GBG29695.1 Serine/threonine-protein kinase Nek2 [Hondaea fermentalgiana]
MTSFERYFDEDAQVVVNASLTGELWEEYYDENGALYYYERSSGATAWELPDNAGAAASSDEINALDADYPLYYEHAQDPGYPQYQEYAPDETYTQDQEYVQHQNYSQGQEYSLDQEYLQDQGLSPEQEYDQGQDHVRNSQLQSTTGVEGQDANEYAYQYDDPTAATAAAYYDSSAYDNLGADQAYDYTFDETANYEEPNPPYADTDPDYNTVHPEATDIGDAGITSPMAFDETNATYYQTLGNDTSSEWTSFQEPQWVTYYDEESQLPYYVDLTTGQSAWELPPGTNPMPDADQLAWDTGDDQDLASPVFKLHSEYGSLSYGQMLGLLARDTLFRSKLAAASGSWRVKPTSLHHDFKEADKDKDEQKGAVNSLEPIKITVRIPFDCEQIIDPKLAETPYAHLSRQKEWDAESQKRTLAHNEKVMAFESKMRRRKTIETERRRVFDREKKHEEDRASRERKALRSKLHRRLHEDLREQCTQRLIELANDEVAAREEALRQMQEYKTRKTLYAKSLRALSTARSLRVLAQPVQKPSAEEEIETISEMLSRNVAALNEDEKAQSKIAAFLAPSRQKTFEEWKVQQTASMEKRLEKNLNKHAGQMLRELQERAHRETERRAAFDSETDAAFAAHSEESEAYAAESVRLEYAEMKLRRLEQEAFQSIEKKRKQFLEISTSCFHRGPLRRLEWEETLKTFDKINRSVFKVRDERSGEAQILVRVPLGSTQAEAVKAREALERFRETGTHTLLSRAQRRDDRLPTFSRHLLRVHWTFVHHQRMHWELFILTEYCAGGRLSDVLARMYTSSTEASAIPEPILLRIAEQLTHALRALHLEGLAHLGLEPACIFFDAHNNLKVGIPRDVRSLQSQLGYQPRLAAATLRYAAPELMRIIVDASSAFDPAKADVWSLGAIMYHLATGAPLPSTSFAVAKLVAQPRVRQRRRWFRDLLRMTLQPRAADRATMTDVADFFSDVVDHVELEVSETFNRLLEPISTHAPEVREEVELGTFEASERDPNAASQSIIPAM